VIDPGDGLLLNRGDRRERERLLSIARRPDFRKQRTFPATNYTNG
jgi:hypothetical protein